MGNVYYSNLFDISDTYREKKYKSLLLSSLQNDMRKWTEKIKGSVTFYYSPNYNGVFFTIEIRQYVTFAYVTHTNPVILGHTSELISDNFSKELQNAVDTLRENIYTPEIYEIEKLVGTQHDRKEKLEALEIEQLKPIVEDSYQDWLKDPNEQTAEWIAKIIYSYRKKEDFYNLWMEKFGDIELVNNELKKLKE
jgi:hypothetical protein